MLNFQGHLPNQLFVKKPKPLLLPSFFNSSMNF